MPTSFFKKNSFQIIEREIVESNFIFEQKKSVLKVYDFFSWKLSPLNESHLLVPLDKPISILKEIKNRQTQPIGFCLTSITQIEKYHSYIDFFYIPGEFCRQGDLLEAAKLTEKPLIIEKGLFLCPNDIKRLCEKVKGSDFCLVECGSSNGYSDSILDPRSLFELKNYSPFFGVSLSDAFAPEGLSYSHRPKWLQNSKFIEAFMTTAKAFNSSFYVIKNYGNGKINSDTILSGALN